MVLGLHPTTKIIVFIPSDQLKKDTLLLLVMCPYAFNTLIISLCVNKVKMYSLFRYEVLVF